MKTEVKIKQPDYKTIQTLSRRMDCTVTEADFDTSHPNSLRVDYIISDINRYLRHTGGQLIWR